MLGALLKEKSKELAVTAAVAVTRRRQNSGECAVLVKAEKQGDDNGESTTAEDVRTENPVFRTEYKQSDKNPKGGITLVATSHKKPPVSAAGVCKVKMPAVLFFLLHHIPLKRKIVLKSNAISRKSRVFSQFLC